VFADTEPVTIFHQLEPAGDGGGWEWGVLCFPEDQVYLERSQYSARFIRLQPWFLYSAGKIRLGSASHGETYLG